MGKVFKYSKHPDCPKLFYKYKSIASQEELLRLYDILKNGRIYLPNYVQLNDPLEGSALGNLTNKEYAPVYNKETGNFEMEDKAYEAFLHDVLTDQEDWYIRERKMHYRILSLSSEPRSHQLWAHYGLNHSGVCLCFKTNASFSYARPIKYIPVKDDIDRAKEIITDTAENVEDVIIRNWFHKQEDWRYEKEWRIISFSEDLDEIDYLHFTPEELVAVVLGEKVPQDMEDIIRQWLPKNTKLLRTLVGQRSLRIYITPSEFKREDAINAESIPDINMEDLLKEPVKA